MAQVLLEKLTKIYGKDIIALDNICLNIVDGEFMVIVGPSGCGKTTLLRMIAGLEEITHGTISIDGQIVNTTPPHKRDVAMVFQNYALYPHMSVFDNMAFGLKFRRISRERIKKQVEAAANLLKIQHLLTRKPYTLSGGQRQRVAVGKALAQNPGLFLFDEPLSNLDNHLRLSTRAEFQRMRKKLTNTAVYVTHDQTEAMVLGDRVCVMNQGMIHQTAPPLEIYYQPTDRFVAGFFGIPPMNFFEGIIRVKNDIASFVMPDITFTLDGDNLKQLSNYKDQKMILGIRPEHFSIKPVNSHTGNYLEAEVEFTESVGNRTDIYCVTKSSQEFIASFSPTIAFPKGEMTKFFIDIDKINIFEPGEKGKNIQCGNNFKAFD